MEYLKEAKRRGFLFARKFDSTKCRVCRTATLDSTRASSQYEESLFKVNKGKKCCLHDYGIVCKKLAQFHLHRESCK